MSRVSRQRFPSVLRLTRRSEFRTVYEDGVRVAGEALVLFVRPCEVGGPRLGLTAPRRVGTSVTRNRVRRRLREAFRRNRESFDQWDVVVNIRDAAARRSGAEIQDELLGLARRARRILAGRQGDRR